MRRWRALPAAAFRTVREPGPYAGEPPMILRVAETRTPLAGDAPRLRGVRTLVAVEGDGRTKERWHVL